MKSVALKQNEAKVNLTMRHNSENNVVFSDIGGRFIVFFLSSPLTFLIPGTSDSVTTSENVVETSGKRQLKEVVVHNCKDKPDLSSRQGGRRQSQGDAKVSERAPLPQTARRFISQGRWQVI